MVNFYDRYDRNPIKISHDFNNDNTDDYIFAEVAESIVDENIGDGLQNIVVSKNDSKKRILAIKAATKSTIGGVIVGDGIDVDAGKISIGQDVREQLTEIEETAAANLLEAKRFTVETIESLKDGVGTAYDTLKEIEDKFNNDDNITASIIKTISDNDMTINTRVSNEVNTLNERIDNEVSTINTTINTEITNLTTHVNKQDLDINNRIDSLTLSTSENLKNTKDELNNRITDEVSTLNLRIDTETSTLNKRINTEVDTLNNVITSKEADLTRKVGVVQSNLDAHRNNKGNPHAVTAEQVGLGNVTNESKLTMFNNPTFTGIVTVPTVSAADSTTKAASTSFVTTAIANYLSKTQSRYFYAVDTLNGMNGRVITHNLGGTQYACIPNVIGNPTGEVGDITYVKGANSVTVYNTGNTGIQFDVTLIKLP